MTYHYGNCEHFFRLGIYRTSSSAQREIVYDMIFYFCLVVERSWLPGTRPVCEEDPRSE